VLFGLAGGVAFALRYTAAGPTPAPAAFTEAASAPAEAAAEPAASHLGVITSSRRVVIAAERDGRLREVLVSLGDVVETGAPLATMNADVLEKELSFALASVDGASAEQQKGVQQLSETRDILARVEGLGPVASEQEKTSASYAVEVKQSELQRAQAVKRQQRARLERVRVELSQATIRAPFDGKVAQIFVAAGAPVVAGTPLFSLASRDGLILRFAVAPAAARRVAPGQRAQATIDGFARPLEASIEKVAPEVDAASNLVFVEARIVGPADSARELVAGLVARVSLVGEPSLTATAGRP
jgi:RND family efflux transporter MFP subunit